MKICIVLAMIVGCSALVLLTSCATSAGGSGELRVSGVAYPSARPASAPVTKSPAKPVPDEYKQKMAEAIEKEKAGNFKQAVELYREIIAAIPDVSAPYARLACIFQRLGYGKEASRMFTKCHVLGGEGLPFYTNRMIVEAPKTESELFSSRQVTRGFISESESEGEWCVDLLPGVGSATFSFTEGRGGSLFGFGVGSVLWFDRKDWVPFLGVKYRKGGVNVTANGLLFMDATERQETDGSVSVFKAGEWTK